MTAVRNPKSLWCRRCPYRRNRSGGGTPFWQEEEKRLSDIAILKTMIGYGRPDFRPSGH
jgi:hypothetical protein